MSRIRLSVKIDIVGQDIRVIASPLDWVTWDFVGCVDLFRSACLACIGE